MTVEETKVLKITCDNPDCPGTDLPSDDRTGWTFVNAEVYGDPSSLHVYCSATCAAHLSEVLSSSED